MDLQTLSWPRPRVLKQEESYIRGGGFRSTVQASNVKYHKANKAYAVEAEVARVDKIEAPLTPAKEKEQSHQELLPDQVKDLAEEKSAVVISTGNNRKRSSSPAATPPRKKRKITIF